MRKQEILTILAFLSFFALFLANAFAQSGKSDGCRVEGIVFDKAKPVVVVEGEAHFISDSVCNGKIVSISPDKVVIRFQDMEKEYKIGDLIIASTEKFKMQGAAKATAMSSYKVLKENKNQFRNAVSILVPKDISKDDLRILLTELHDSYRATYQNVIIWAFVSKEQAESGAGLWVAMISTGTNGNADIKIDEKQLEYLQAKPAEKFGLSEEKRLQIFTEICEGENQAYTEALKVYPPLDYYSPGVSGEAFLAQERKEIQLRNELKEKYKNKLSQKYGLTREQLNEIAIEGGVNKWPIPRSAELEKLMK